MKALFVVEFLKDLSYDHFYFVFLSMIFRCILLAIQLIDMFADDISLNTSDKDTDTVQKELQRSINEASDWCDNNATILHPSKIKTICYLLLGKNIGFARFTLILVLKTVILNRFMSTGTLALLLMMNLAGDHTLLAHVKRSKKIIICVMERSGQRTRHRQRSQ